MQMKYSTVKYIWLKYKKKSNLNERKQKVSTNRKPSSKWQYFGETVIEFDNLTPCPDPRQFFRSFATSTQEV